MSTAMRAPSTFPREKVELAVKKANDKETLDVLDLLLCYSSFANVEENLRKYRASKE